MLTRRGWALLLVALVGVGMAAEYGARSLNAVVAPMVIALVAGVVQVYLTRAPDVERVVPEDGFAGEDRVVRLRVEASAPVAGVVHDAVAPELSATGNRMDTTVESRTYSYTVHLDRRGVHDLGPLSVEVRDVLGLARRTFSYDDVDTLLSYPQVYDITGAERAVLTQLTDRSFDPEREEFDRLREYQRGDSLRDVHWKSSAKRTDDEMTVKEFESEDELVDLWLTAEGAGGRDDDLAEAAASIAMYLLDAGLAVGVSVPAGSVEPDVGADHRVALLSLLARTGPGNVPREDFERADVSVRVPGPDSAVYVDIGGQTVTFAGLAGGRGSVRTRSVRRTAEEADPDATPNPAPAAAGAGGESP